MSTQIDGSTSAREGTSVVINFQAVSFFDRTLIFGIRNSREDLLELNESTFVLHSPNDSASIRGNLPDDGNFDTDSLTLAVTIDAIELQTPLELAIIDDDLIPYKGQSDVNPTAGTITIHFPIRMTETVSPSFSILVDNQSTSATGSTFNWSQTTNGKSTLIISLSWVYFPEGADITWQVTGLTDFEGNPFTSLPVAGSFKTIVRPVHYSVTDTGQLACSDTVGNSITCIGTGQDAEFTNLPRARSFTGPTQHGSFPSDFTTVDDTTNLIWQACSIGQAGNNCQLMGNSANNYNATSMNWYTAINTCQSLNQANGFAGYAGRVNWRLPTVRELYTIPDFNFVNPAVDPTYFPATAPGNYWASTAAPDNSDKSFTVFFGDGTHIARARAETHFVRCVSESIEPAASEYTVNGDGTVTDVASGLIWQRCAAGLAVDNQCTGTATVMNWNLAFSYCNNLDLANRNWRLPNINALKSLVDFTRLETVIDTDVFPSISNTIVPQFASSTSYIGNQRFVLTLNFHDGRIGSGEKSSPYFVRCVSGP